MVRGAVALAPASRCCLDFRLDVAGGGVQCAGVRDSPLSRTSTCPFDAVEPAEFVRCQAKDLAEMTPEVRGIAEAKGFGQVLKGGSRSQEAFRDRFASCMHAGASRRQAVEVAVAFAESLEKLFAPPDLAAGDDAVQIMTVHKSKGLEFDTVIVPGLDRAPRANTAPLLMWKLLPQTGLLLAPIHAAGGVKDACYEYVRRMESAAEELESGRLLYVAATRAKSRLHLLGCIKRDDSGAAKQPVRRSLLRPLWPLAADQVAPAAAPAAAPAVLIPRAPMLSRFADGFDVPVSLFGASYVAPKRGQNVINLANSPAAVEFGAGDLSQDPLVLLPLELPTLNESRVLRNVAEKFSLQVIPSTGVFQGSFREPSGKARSFRGILLQPAGVGLGFYLQEAGTGTVGNGGGDPGPK